MEKASTAVTMTELLETEDTNHSARQTFAKLKISAGSLHLIASISLLLVLLTVLPLAIEDTMDMTDVVCGDKLNADALAAWVGDHQFTDENAPYAQRLAMMLKPMFRMNPLSIMMAWGSFTFPVAKIIDTAWNLIISRIGQIVFGILTGRVITAWLVQKMELQSVPYQLFRETALSRSYSIVVLWYLFDRKRCSRLWKNHRLQLFGFAVCLTFVMVHPVLSDAMTGYTARRTQQLKGLNGDVLEDQQRDDNRLLRVDFSIDNGHLLNLSDPTYVFRSPGSRSGYLEPGSPPKLTTFQGELFFSEVTRCKSVLISPPSSELDFKKWITPFSFCCFLLILHFLCKIT